MEKYGNLDRDETLTFVGYNAPTLLEIYKRCLPARSVELSKHVIYYGPRPGFLYYNQTLEIKRTTLSVTWERVGSFVD
jgi:hypothetical protein